jgi:hypothetical protein
MSKKLSSVSLAIVSGAAVAVCAASCSSSSPSNPTDGGSSSSSSGGSSSSSGGSSSSSSGGSSSSGSGGGDASEAGSSFACVGNANSQTLIDNESAPTGTALSSKVTLTPAGCGNTGTWFDYNNNGGTTTQPVGTMFTFSPRPAGLPADSGVPTSDAAAAGDAAAVGPAAACLAGVTGTTQYASLAGVGFNLATLPPADAGVNAVPLPVNASSHTGIQFWAWGGGDAGTQSVILSVGDQNETPGLGPAGGTTPTGTFCDPTNGAATACGPTTKTVLIAPGWQLIQVAFTELANNPSYGNANETSLDTTALTQVQWQVQEVAVDASAGIPFDFCLYGVSFY